MKYIVLSIRFLVMLGFFVSLLIPMPALAHGGIPDGPKRTFTQAIGSYELAVTIELPTATPAPLFVDILPLRDPGTAEVVMRAAPRNQSFDDARSAQVTTLPGSQGVYYTQLEVDRPGDWELEIQVDGALGGGIARIPFTIVPAPLPPFTIPLFTALGLLTFLMITNVMLAALFQHRQHPVPSWIDRLLGYGMFAALIAAVIFGGLQWRDSVQQSQASTSLSGRPHANLTLSTVPAAPQANQPLELTLDLSDGGTGLPVDDLISHHEALVHLVVLSDDGAFMNHLHPPRIAQGRFSIPITPDRAGRYSVYAEIERQDSGTQVIARDFFVAGSAISPPPPPPGLGQRTVGGLLIDVTSSVETLTAGRQTTLTFSFSEEGRPVQDLQPWLGMAGHLFARSADQSIFAHIHAAERMVSTDPTVTGIFYGPTVRFVYTFPRPGSYQVWAQFRRNSDIITVPLRLEVQ